MGCLGFMNHQLYGGPNELVARFLKGSCHDQSKMGFGKGKGASTCLQMSVFGRYIPIFVLSIVILI